MSQTDGPRERGLCLALNTAGELCATAVYDIEKQELLSSCEADIGRGHADLLMEQVAEVLGGAGCDYSQLSKIAVANGPGSFTGLRVGISAARGLALALNIPAVGIGVLEALAFPLLHHGKAVLAVQDARRGEVFAALYAADGSLRATPTAIAPDQLESFCQSVQGQSIYVTGTGGFLAQAAMPNAVLNLVNAQGHIELRVMGQMATGRTAVEAVRPLYLRGADAKPQQAISGIVVDGSLTNNHE
ncbi:tRNA (adenosine(37)-N6)-threonylcarbamoyltransferase complex dimerization subunit type 1 TsaB [Aureimonas fodinaquatilis]|uniref:N(6)-L-threonylcarbamoyladenine synthase n=1 Tax=Aureimonas fodinaquatilis TaxID=2565783 RepID=A0A5B0DQ03_9HYPH|nr:tRNA (adenosine(37)-N6)-threonylcarbamoyltransferase complex dimerization subunit type 1 TsaB [Aureimonas fodinaquatilis]KAA0968566.1 tRNA (adenosine(37)-N6)-threonylcarbamoyltransferase complex dimerization subunit type 1 TsaB [Aureimonas fodinaquatilis]